MLIAFQKTKTYEFGLMLSNQFDASEGANTLQLHPYCPHLEILSSTNLEHIGVKVNFYPWFLSRLDCNSIDKKIYKVSCGNIIESHRKPKVGAISPKAREIFSKKSSVLDHPNENTYILIFWFLTYG